MAKPRGKPKALKKKTTVVGPQTNKARRRVGPVAKPKSPGKDTAPVPARKKKRSLDLGRRRAAEVTITTTNIDHDLVKGRGRRQQRHRGEQETENYGTNVRVSTSHLQQSRISRMGTRGGGGFRRLRPSPFSGFFNRYRDRHSRFKTQTSVGPTRGGSHTHSKPAGGASQEEEEEGKSGDQEEQEEEDGKKEQEKEGEDEGEDDEGNPTQLVYVVLGIAIFLLIVALFLTSYKELPRPMQQHPSSSSSSSSAAAWPSPSPSPWDGSWSDWRFVSYLAVPVALVTAARAMYVCTEWERLRSDPARRRAILFNTCKSGGLLSVVSIPLGLRLYEQAFKERQREMIQKQEDLLRFKLVAIFVLGLSGLAAAKLANRFIIHVGWPNRGAALQHKYALKT